MDIARWLFGDERIRDDEYQPSECEPLVSNGGIHHAPISVIQSLHNIAAITEVGKVFRQLGPGDGEGIRQGLCAVDILWSFLDFR